MCREKELPILEWCVCAHVCVLGALEGQQWHQFDWK